MRGHPPAAAATGGAGPGGSAGSRAFVHAIWHLVSSRAMLRRCSGESPRSDDRARGFQAICSVIG
jgi:hypothetical protein